MHMKIAALRAAQALVGTLGAAVAIGEGSERYDASRHVVYATQRLKARRGRLQQHEKTRDGSAEEEDGSQNHALWLQREIPKFPYVMAISPADTPSAVASALIGTSEYVVGSSDENEPTTAMIDALVVPDDPLDVLVQRVALQWQAFKTRLHGDVPAAFDPQRDGLTLRLDAVLTALRAVADTSDNGGAATEVQASGSPQQSPNATLVFFLRDFDDWNDATKSTWFQWIHSVTKAGLAHVILPTQATITPTVISNWQRIHKVADADFVAILLWAATHACDPSSASEKLTVLSQQFELDLRGLKQAESGVIDADDVIGYEPPAPPTEAELIIETVGDWWSDMEKICRALEHRGLSQLKSDDERLELVQQVCDECERDAMAHVVSTVDIFDHDKPVDRDDGETRERRISALQAWKCLQVVTGVGDDAQMLASPEKLLQKDTSKPINCVHPVEALLPFNQRIHGEAKFLELLDREILFLRPKNDVEISVVPCETASLVAPCWVETRPLIKRAVEKLWRDDVHYSKVLELERFEDNFKMSEELNLFEDEILERRQLLDKQTREFIMLQHTMKKHQIAQRKAELSLLELEIQSKLAYLERLRNLLD